MLTTSVKINKLCLLSFPLMLLLLIPFSSSFAQLALGKSKFLGNVIGDNIRPTTFKKYWNQVTPGNAGKWGHVEASRNTYTWTTLDNIYNYAKSNGLLYKHHTLIWGSQQPSWISTLDSATQRQEIEEWIRLVGERYPNIDFIDVVNEPFNAPPDGQNNRANYIKALGGTGKTGWDWIITSFQLARQYCSPTAKLFINEYNILHDNKRTTDYLRLIDTLRVRGLIDGIAIQGHYFEFKGTNYTYDISTIKQNLNRLVATGLPVYISEFDINEADDNLQLQNYQTYFPIFWENPGVKGITLWGYVQYDTWLTNAYLLTSAGVERPAMTWLKTYVMSPFKPTLVYPIKMTNLPRNLTFKWNTSETAEKYHFQLSTSSVFPSTQLILDTVVTDTTLYYDSLLANKTYYWRVSGINSYGESPFSDYAWFITGSYFVGLKEAIQKSMKFELKPNYPNPFNAQTTISYSIPNDGYVELKILNLYGQEVVTLLNKYQPAGEYKITFDAKDYQSGLYICLLRQANKTVTQKMILLK